MAKPGLEHRLPRREPAPLQLPLDAFGLGMNDKSIHTGLCPGGNERTSRRRSP
jgi:hypothetical protein